MADEKPLVELKNVTFTYPQATEPTLQSIDLTVSEGELCLVIGHTGSGKSTLLTMLNGLVPHFTGGTLTGEVLIGERSTKDYPPRELADLVGVVGQDPIAGFVTDHVEDELAYVMESLGVPEPVMRKRVEETLDLLGLATLRERPLATLSGGQQQRVAIGAALTAHPQILVLDEPTSALDPGAAEEVLAVLHRLVHDLAMTVILAEHRLERVVQYADRVIWLPGDGSLTAGTPGEILITTPLAPPIVALGRIVGWRPPPVSIREARRKAAALQKNLNPAETPLTAHNKPVLSVQNLEVHHNGIAALQKVNIQAAAGERIAIMGRNGAGKSSLLWAIQGTGHRTKGAVLINGQDPATLRPRARSVLAGLVPQQPTDLLYLETVEEECHNADTSTGAKSGTCQILLDSIVSDIPQATHPRDLSEGQRLALALAVILTGQPQVVALDEPTRGLDYPAKTALTARLSELANHGHTVIVTTHDVEFVAEYAERVIVLADGEVVADGAVADVVTASPLYAPQLAKVFAPHRILTVAQAASALGLSDSEVDNTP